MVLIVKGKIAPLAITLAFTGSGQTFPGFAGIINGISRGICALNEMQNKTTELVPRQNSINRVFNNFACLSPQPKISRSKSDPSVEGSLITAS
jgi:hypothetical protein